MSTASTTALGSVLSALNDGSSGIDVTTVVAQIIQAEGAPVTAWQAQQTTLGQQSTEITQLESEASTLSDTLNTLGDFDGILTAVQATSSNTSAVSASAVAGTPTGTHSIQVTSLATSAAWYSNDLSSGTSTLSAGSFAITQGSTTTSIQVTDGESLSDLAASINGQNLGINASVVTDSNGSRLSLTGSNSGTAADFTVSSGGDLSFTRAATGKDASLTVDGVPISSATNVVTGAVSGLTLTLQSATTSPVTVTLGPDEDSIGTAVQNFVTAYNNLIGDLNGQFTFSATSGSEGVLGADSVARSMQMDLLGAANMTVGSGAIQNLTELGVTTNNDGTLSLDADTLESAINNNFSDVVSFFQGTGSTGGFSTALNNTLNTYTDFAQGAFTVDLQGITNENQDLQDQINTFDLYLSNQQTLLTNEYNNANIALQQLPQQIKQIQALLGEDNSSNS